MHARVSEIRTLNSGRGCLAVARVGAGPQQALSALALLSPMPLLDELPDHLLLDLYINHGLSACDLGRLECVGRHFVRKCAELKSGGEAPGRPIIHRHAATGAATLAECAAEARVTAHRDGWRVVARAGESFKYLLFVLECRLWPLQQIAAGDSHSLAIAAGKGGSSELLAFGCDSRRQLGLGTNTAPQHMMALVLPGTNTASRTVAQKVVALSGHSAEVVATVACGSWHSCAVTAPAGKLYAWGRASNGELGLGKAVCENPNTVVGCPCPVRGLPPRAVVSLVSAGVTHTACLTATGHVFSWGSGASGRLGHGDTLAQLCPRRVASLAGRARCVGLHCGRESTAVVTVAGECLLCGKLPYRVVISIETHLGDIPSSVVEWRDSPDLAPLDPLPLLTPVGGSGGGDGVGGGLGGGQGAAAASGANIAYVIGM